MMKNMRSGQANLFKGGTKYMTGVEATVRRNIEACSELAKLTRTSYGPNGMNKMVINHLGKLFVTNDAATIIREMEIQAAAAKMVLMASNMQEQEIGDGSNFVVIFAGELMHQAEALLDLGLKPIEILTGYEFALNKALEILDELVVKTVEAKDMFNKSAVADAIRTAIASKQYGQESFLASLIAEACIDVMPKNPANFLVDNVRVVKLLGQSTLKSEVIKGMVIPHDVVGTTRQLKDAKVAIFTCGLEPEATETKGTVLIESAAELMTYNETEEKLLQKKIESLRDAGVRCVVFNGGVTDMAKHFLEKYEIMAVKVSSQHDIRRLARATKGTAIVKFQTPSPEELGFCGRIFVREMGLDHVTVFQQDEKDTSNLSTVVLRGSTQNVLDDVERAVDDGVNVARAVARDGRVVAGAGAVDIELARRMHAYADSLAGIAQHAVKAFADALEVVPRILAENAGLVAMDIVSQLYAAHEAGNSKVGVNIEDGTVQDMTESGVFDHLKTKANGIKLASNTVITMLRIDQIIQSKPAGGPKAPSNQGHWDDRD